MLSNVRRAKFTHYFHVTNLSGDEVITKDDYLMAAERAIQVLGIPSDSQPAQALRGAYARYWDALAAADANHDNAVTLDEWIAHFDQLGKDPTQVEAIVVSRGKQIVQMFDHDHDDQVSRDEFEKFFKAAGFPEKDYSIAFEKMDRNGDGQLSLEELLAAGREFFASDDPNAVGNWIYGDYTKYL